MKRIVYTPAGRYRYMSLLVRHLAAQQDDFDEYHVWVNPRNEMDRGALFALPRSGLFKPGKLKLICRDVHRKLCNWHQLVDFWDDALDPDAVYIRLDDDIVWMEPGFVDRLFKIRMANQDPWFVSANVVNNPICSALYQRQGVIDESLGRLELVHNDPLGYGSALVGARMHRELLADRQRLEKFDFGGHYLPPGERIPINAISFFGRDTREHLFPFSTDDEELHFTTVLTKKTGRGTLVVGRPVCAHFAYHVQEEAMLNAGTLVAYQDAASEDL